MKYWSIPSVIRIGQVTGAGSAVLARGHRRPRPNASDHGSVAEPIRNRLVKDLFIYQQL